MFAFSGKTFVKLGVRNLAAAPWLYYNRLNKVGRAAMSALCSVFHNLGQIQLIYMIHETALVTKSHFTLSGLFPSRAFFFFFLKA